MISIFILPSNRFRNWDTQREELTDAQREKEREKERLIDTQREKDHVVDRDLAFVPIAISRNTAPIVISQSVNRDLAKHWSRSREALRRLQSCLRADHDRSTAPRDLAFASAARSRPLSNPVTSLSSFFSQFDRIWRFFFFFPGFCLRFCIEEWMILYICLATEKMWENVTGFDRIWWFFFLGFVCVSVLRNECYYIFVWQPRKCEQQVENVFSMVFSRTQPNTRKYFSKHFLKCNQTHKNIFLSGK